MIHREQLSQCKRIVMPTLNDFVILSRVFGYLSMCFNDFFRTLRVNIFVMCPIQ